MAPTTESATCWVVTTPDGRLIYASNTGSASISSFSVGGIADFTIGSSGELVSLPGSTNGTQPMSASGLAAR